MLMTETKLDAIDKNSWYLDSGCLTHMTRRKDWFICLNEVNHGRIRFADDSCLHVEGSGRVIMKDNDDKE